MFGPLRYIGEPIVLLVLVIAFLFGLVLHNIVQTRVAAHFGDRSALLAGFGRTDPQRHFDLFSLLWYAVLGFGRVQPIPMRLNGQGGVLTMLAGPLTLFVWAFVLLVAERLLENAGSATLALRAGLSLAAGASLLHTAFYLIPLPGLDGGRALWASGNREGRLFLSRTEAAGPIVYLLIWVVLSFTGVLNAIITPLTLAMQRLLGLLPL